MKTLLFGVLYPGLNDGLIIDYVRSVIDQKDRDFDWLMINDNAGQDQLHLFPKNIKWIDLKTPFSFGKIREAGINYAKEDHYECIIFSDIDDYYSPDRVGETKLHLKKHDFVFTELQVVNFEKQLTHKDLLHSLKADPAPATIEAIIDYNYIGLSHSAVRISALDEFEISEDIEVVDWWIFSLLLIWGCQGEFMADVDTFYRQNNENYVGVYNLLDPKRLQRGIEVKLNHYEGLLKYCQKRKKGTMSDIFNKKYQEMAKLKELMKEHSFTEKYISVINSNFNKLYKGWWSEILPLDQWERYER